MTNFQFRPLIFLEIDICAEDFRTVGGGISAETGLGFDEKNTVLRQGSIRRDKLLLGLALKPPRHGIVRARTAGCNKNVIRLPEKKTADVEGLVDCCCWKG